MNDAIEELSHSLLQVQGSDHVRKRAAYQLPPQKELQYVFDCNGDTKLRSDMSKQLDFSVETGTIQPAETAEKSLTVQCFQFNTQKKKYALLEHHSCCIVYSKTR